MGKLWVMLLCFNCAWCNLHDKNAQDKCDDCMPILECKEASPYLNVSDETLRVISEFYCGIQNYSINVCCSKLKESVNEKPHPNLKLLPDNCGKIFNGIQYRMLTGETESNLNEFPWMVPMYYYNQNGLSFICSGTLINSRYVLTAAHCLHVADIAGIRVGEHKIGMNHIDCTGDDCATNIQDIEVNEAIIHEDFNPFDNNAHDIALLRLAQNVNMTFVNAGTICLPVTEELQRKVITSRHGTVAGWRKTEYNHNARLLIKEFVAVRSNKQCQKYYSYVSTSDTNRFCAGQQRTDSCERNKGGPLMLQDSYKGTVKMVQYGIVTFGAINCGSGTPGIYTNVRSYIKWILDNIKE